MASEYGLVFLCGGETGTGSKRDEPDEGTCDSALHNWPLPSNYVSAHEEAGWRLRNNWKSTRCNLCKKYGWIPGKITENHHEFLPEKN